MSENQKQTKRERLKAYITKRNIIVTVFVAFLVFQYIQIQSILGTFSFLEGKDSSLVDEVGQLRDFYTKFGNDLVEVRRYLRLPVNDYLVNDDFEKFESNDDRNQNELQLAMFRYVEFLANDRRLADGIAKNQSYLAELYKDSFAEFLKEKKLKILPLANNVAQIVSANDENLLKLEADDEGKLFRSTILGKDEVKYDTVEDFKTELVSFIEANQLGIEKVSRGVKKLNADIAAAVASEETKKVMGELGIKIDDSFKIFNKVDDLIGEIAVDAESVSVYFYDEANKNLKIKVDEVGKSLVPFLQKLDAQTYTEKKAAAALKSLEATLNDKGFKLLLSSAGLKMLNKPREDDLRYYYDIYSGKTHLSSIVLEKKTGVVNIVDADGSKSENLLMFDAKLKKKL
ncbi:hypothetical protein COU74_01135 [Candidatus Peregrinibacteria bacterium CG10_big_fil_rev_8_21_14_0_10_36_19]|nr:MAG: hypothetical protein COU74_01135 [Candidatus Peregrinibacteria bacterium CG10_big_fil_rev_8_21_14_0_10_36_19]